MADHLILGAGLAGLTLALELRRAGVGGTIVLVDGRQAYGRDRTWCLWGVRPHPYSGLESASWDTWEVVTERGAARHSSARHRYVHLDSRDVYAHALARIEADPGVELRLGERIDAPPPPTAAGRVYDALGSGSPWLRGVPPGGIALTQDFVGWDVEVDRPRFDPGVATLMDFRVPQQDGLRFLYVLPFSPTRALVEDTSFAAGGPSPAARRELLEVWLGPGEWTVHHEERGAIPMTDRAFPHRHPDGAVAVGTAGGAGRPSSGYAFARTMRQCRAVAQAVARGEADPSARAASPRSALMDGVFLEALAREPEAFPERFRTLVQRTPPDAFARFMDDAASPADELRVVAALPKLPFIAAAAARARRAGPAGRARSGPPG